MNRGFTILELLVGAVVLAVLSAAIGTILLHGQWSLQTQTDLTRSIEQSRVALDLIVRYLRQAGNDPFATLEEGGIPAVTILGPGAVQISSDVTGSRASTSGDARESTGDPDGSLDSIHEQVLFRFEESNHRLMMDIGYGPEVLVENLDLFELRYFDALGNETNDSNQVARVNIRMVPVMESASLQTGDIYGTTISSDVFLQASSYNIFGGDPYSNGIYNGNGSGGGGPAPDPSGDRRRSVRSAPAWSPRTASRALRRSSTLTPVSGSRTSRAICVMNRSRLCDPPRLRKPRPFPSVLMYSVAFSWSSCRWCSAHSVDPSNAGSSASQAA